MEKQINDLSILNTYQNRQVIVNYYQDEDILWKRDGFYFESVHISTEVISFKRKNASDFHIFMTDFPNRYINSDFQNYYILRYNTDKIEIYFP